MSLPSARPLALAVRSSSGRSSLPLLWNGPETATSSLPPSFPLESTASERSMLPLSTPSRVALSRTVCGSSLLLPPQAANAVARALRTASRTKMRKPLKRSGSAGSKEEETADPKVWPILVRGDSRSPLRSGRLLTPSAHPHFDFIVDGAHHLDPCPALGLGRNQAPAGAAAIGAVEHLLDRLLVLAALGAVLPVFGGQLPGPPRIVFAALETLQLLLEGDVKPELDQDRALFGQALLEGDDLLVGPAPLLFAGEALDPLD